MDVYRRGGDSLMGRYFPYHMHPFSVAEILKQDLPDTEQIIRPPQKIRPADFDALWNHGGYPEPFLKRDARFSRRWVDLLVSLHLGFLVRPWFRNVSRSLRKEPKWFLRDWATIKDAGDKTETLVACHLLKAVDGWNDMGLGKFELGYLRDKEKREVDFVVAREGQPWFLVEVKQHGESISPALKYFQQQLDAPFAFQVVLDSKYIDADCFARPGAPIVVPARTFLSQLL